MLALFAEDERFRLFNFSFPVWKICCCGCCLWQFSEELAHVTDGVREAGLGLVTVCQFFDKMFQYFVLLLILVSEINNLQGLEVIKEGLAVLDDFPVLEFLGRFSPAAFGALPGAPKIRQRCGFTLDLIFERDHLSIQHVQLLDIVGVDVIHGDSVGSVDGAAAAVTAFGDLPKCRCPSARSAGEKFGHAHVGRNDIAGQHTPAS